MRSRWLAIPIVLLSLAPGLAQAPDAAKPAIAYVQALQTPEGAFLPARPMAGGKALPSLRATSAGVRALKYFGGEVRNRAGAAAFIAQCFDKASGGFADRPGGKPDVTLTAVGAMAAAELQLPPATYRDAVVRYLGEHAKSFEEIRIAVAGLEALGVRSPQARAWLEEIARLRNPDGTYGKGEGVARQTGSAVVAVLRLGGTVEQRDRVLQALRSGQRADGGFGKEDAKTSDLETTYRVLRAFHMLKEKPANPEACRAFVARCRNADGGYGVEPGQPSGVGPTYYASIILHWLAAP